MGEFQLVGNILEKQKIANELCEYISRVGTQTQKGKSNIEQLKSSPFSIVFSPRGLGDFRLKFRSLTLILIIDTSARHNKF